MMTTGGERGKRFEGAGSVAAVVAGTALLLAAGPGLAAPITIQGDDEQTLYDFSTGLLSFIQGAFDFQSGVMTTIDNAAIADCPGGVCDIRLRAWLNVDLGANGKTGAPFDPTTDNARQAQFLGVSGGGGPGPMDFVIFRADDGADNIFDPATESNNPEDILLAFQVNWLNVSGGLKTGQGGDPDGQLEFGGAFLTNLDSEFVLVGGSLANDFGGAGTVARFGMTWDTLTPAIPAGAGGGPYQGYLGQDVLSGDGSAPIQATRWTLVLPELVVVPEPGTALLLGSALCALSLSRRRQRR